MSILPITDVINVTVTNTPQGLTTPNINSVALFATETPVNNAVSLAGYGIYTSASQVATDWGTNATVTNMATAMFAQSPNILSGNGQLVILPMLSAVSATSGYFTTASIAVNLAAIIAVTNGNLKVTVDGVINNLSALNFTACTTLAQVATVLQAALPNCLVTGSATALTFTSKKVGASGSSVALAAYSGGGTDLTGSGYFNTASGTATAGTNSSGETIAAAITRTSGLVSYSHVLSDLNIEDAVVTTTATAVQALDMLFYQQFCSTADIAGEITTITTATDTHTRCLFYSLGQTAANLFKAAYVGRNISTNYTGNSTVSTANLKQLATISPDTGITQTLYTTLLAAGADFYPSVAGYSCIISSGANDYLDNQYANLSLKLDLEYAGFNYLATTTTKIPQTESGMNGLKDAYRNVLKNYVVNGELAPGTWTSANTFGDPVTFLTNISQIGYYIYSSPIASQSVSNRNNRIAPLVQIACKRAGAIHSGNVLVVINA